MTIKTAAFDRNPALTDAEMLTLNGQKSSDNVPQRKVARDWLIAKGFIGADQN